MAVTAGGLAPRPLAVLRVAGYAQRLLSDLVALALKEGAKARRPKTRPPRRSAPFRNLCTLSVPAAEVAFLCAVLTPRLLACCSQEIVVGVPYMSHGAQLRSTQQTKRCRQFAERLADEAGPAGVRVWWSDENDSSVEAARALEASGAGAARRDALLDAVAAAVILARAFSDDAVPRHVTPALHLSSAPQKADRPPKDLVRYRELKLDAPPRPQPAAAAAPAKGMSVELLRRARGGAAARLQSWGDLLIDEEEEEEATSSAAALVEQLG